MCSHRERAHEIHAPFITLSHHTRLYTFSLSPAHVSSAPRFRCLDLFVLRFLPFPLAPLLIYWQKLMPPSGSFPLFLSTPHIPTYLSPFVLSINQYLLQNHCTVYTYIYIGTPSPSGARQHVSHARRWRQRRHLQAWWISLRNFSCLDI